MRVRSLFFRGIAAEYDDRQMNLFITNIVRQLYTTSPGAE